VAPSSVVSVFHGAALREPGSHALHEGPFPGIVAPWPRGHIRCHPSLEGTSDVHLWSAPLDLGPDVCAQLAPLLSPDEIERASRFVFDRDRRRYALGRGVLRLLLSAYTAPAPHEHAFSYGARGKPMLEGALASRLHFNVAHSGERLLVGLTTIGPIGVDVEHRRTLGHMNDIVRRTFSPAEAATFRALPRDERVDAFYRGWTCKEAFVKMSGEGLAIPLHTFEVALAPHEGPRITRVGDERDCASRWTLVHLRPSPEYDAAVCVNAPATRIEAWSLDGVEINEALRPGFGVR
jgi:4'-phosphopantetheinyl transferase